FCLAFCLEHRKVDGRDSSPSWPWTFSLLLEPTNYLESHGRHNAVAVQFIPSVTWRPYAVFRTEAGPWLCVAALRRVCLVEDASSLVCMGMLGKGRQSILGR